MTLGQAPVYEYSRILGVIALTFFSFFSSVWFYPRSLALQEVSGVDSLPWHGSEAGPVIHWLATLTPAHLVGRTHCWLMVMLVGLVFQSLP